MENKRYSVGKMMEEWGAGKAQTLTFVVTNDCNLRCKYCYVTHKEKGKIMSLQTAKKFIDLVLMDEERRKCEAVILDFIGGEPLLEAQLIEQICDYFKISTYELKCSWYWNYRINITTNGVNYNDNAVQRLIKKNSGKIYIGITLDGTQRKHDLQRVFPDGSGSYSIIEKNISLWMKQFEASTKVTFASEDLKYLKESIIHLWNMGIKNVSANVVYENVWKEDDDIIFEKQLKNLAEYIIENDLYNKYYCSLFLDYIGMPYTDEEKNNTSCGAGKMLSVSPEGNIYPCMRFYDYSLNKKRGYVIGNVEEGIDYEKVRVFQLAMYKYQCDDECLNCPVAKGCEFCQGFSYDESESGTNFFKTKYICKMHKARVRANNYYFAELFHKKGIRRENFIWKKDLLFLLNDKYESGCSYYNNQSKKNKVMEKETILEGLKYAEKNFLHPIFIHGKEDTGYLLDDYEEIEIMHLIPIELYLKGYHFWEYQIIVEFKNIKLCEKITEQDSIIFNISEKNINELFLCVEYLLKKSKRINVNIQNMSKEFDIQIYEKELKKCAEKIIEIYQITGVLKEINILTDVMFINNHESCGAGDKQYTLAPNGKLYICPAFYSEGLKSCGNMKEGIHIRDERLYKEQYMPLCNKCKAYQCENCKYINKIYTNEINVSPSFQCKKANIEKNIAALLRQALNLEKIQNVKTNSIVDPIEYYKKNY